MDENVWRSGFARMRKVKLVVTVATIVAYLAAAVLSILLNEGRISEAGRLSIIQAVDVLGVSASLSSRSSFPGVVQIYSAFCMYIAPLFFIQCMLAFWAPALPSYEVRIRGLERVKFFIAGVFLSILAR